MQNVPLNRKSVLLFRNPHSGLRENGVPFGRNMQAWRLGQYTDYRACSFSNPINCLILSILGIYSTIQIGRSLYRLCSKNALGQFSNSLIKNTGRWSYHFMALQFLAMKPVSALIAVVMRVPVDKYLGDFGLISIASAWWRIIGFVLTTFICYICAYTIRHLHTIFGNGKIFEI